MSTRGAIGIRFEGKDKVGYNHFDSYPTGIGVSIFEYLKGKTYKELIDEYKSISFIDGSLVDVWNDMDNCFNKEFTDDSEFLYDSLFCEWAYIVNLDTKELEIYKGFNKLPDGEGRYAQMKHRTGYYGVTLFKTIPLKDLFKGMWSIGENDFGDYEFIRKDAKR